MSKSVFIGEDTMFFYSRLFLMFVVSVFLAGCMSPKSFVDPNFPRVSYDDVAKRSVPLRLVLGVEFQRNGEPFQKVDSTLRDVTERVLRASGVVIPIADGGEGQIRVVVNNIADLGGAVAKGFGTGLTFGLAGSTVTDAYEMLVSITANGKTITRTAIKHALHTAIGNTSTPPGLEVMPPSTAFQKVMEQMLLRVLQDVQRTGELASGATSLEVESSSLFDTLKTLVAQLENKFSSEFLR
jgi:hypothetical protein